MKTSIKLVLLAGIVLLTGIVILISNYVKYSNEEVVLRNQIEAQQESNTAFFDRMWKIIQQKAQVSNEYKESFKEIYPELIKGRYDNGQGQLMQWIQESNPTFSTALYQDLMITIEAERKAFFVEQQKLIDLGREHDNLLEVFPSSVFLSRRDNIELIVVTSDKTDEVFINGKEELEPLF